MHVFEQGPIRPPSEAGSLLLRFTRNCPWNRCTFCPVYKRQKFSRRSLGEIRQDIDAVHGILEDLHRISQSMGYGGQLTQQVMNKALSQNTNNPHYQHVAFWAYSGKGTVFIQDANSLILPTAVLTGALKYLREKVPGVQRVTSYARSSTLSRKSLEELREIRESGLDRIHIGLESGSDKVLKFVEKGTTAKEHIDAGRKVVEAGMSLSEYIMPGLGGKPLSREHAIDTARVLNEIDPHFIRLRSLRIPPRVPLYRDKMEGRFLPLSDDETVAEIRLFLETLEGIHSTLTSDHFMNLLQEVEGTFPQDKEKMLGIIDDYLSLSPEERVLYRLGRRGGALQTLEDFKNPHMRHRLQRALTDLQAEYGGDIERVITELGDRYV